MKFTLTIDSDNAGVEDHHDLAEITYKVFSDLADDNFVLGLENKVRDINGNTVGSWTVKS
jgi:hypothetical protein